MWDCTGCGTQNIAHDLTFCPRCFKEADVPKTTVGGGATNQFSDPEAPPADEVAVVPEPADVPAADPVPASEPVAPPAADPQPEPVVAEGGVTLDAPGAGA